MTRTKIREQIFRILFRLEFTDGDAFPEQIAMALEALQAAPDVSETELTYMEEKSRAVADRVEELDALLDEYADGWNLNRIGKAELAILRLAIYEMKFEEDIPEKVAINEALELSKRYCNEDAKGFINAVLGKISRA